MNKYFYILLILTIIVVYLKHVENFNIMFKFHMLPRFNEGICNFLNPTLFLNKEMDEYYKHYVKKKDDKAKSKDKITYSIKDSIGFEKTQYKTPKPFDAYENNILQKQIYPNNQFSNIIPQNGMQLKIFKKV